MHETTSQVSEEELAKLQKARESEIVYKRGLVTSRKWEAGTNAGGLLLSDFFELPISPVESVANSRLGQAVKARLERVKATPTLKK